jgi:intracellular multiplication protein IcmK
LNKRIFSVATYCVIAFATVQAFAQSNTTGAGAQGAQPQGGQGQGVPLQKSAQAQAQSQMLITPDMDDATPPIPTTRKVVQRLVDDTAAKMLTPAEINTLQTTADAARQASVSPYPNGMIATPRSRQLVWRPEVSHAPETIEMWQGTLSTVVFTDSNGNPWNIKSVSLDCNQFDDGRSCSNAQPSLQSTVQGKQASGSSDTTNMMSVQANRPYSYGNVVVRLDGLPTPVIFVLRTGKSTTTDMELDVRVEGRNPSAPPQAMSLQGLPAYDEQMGDFLSGIPPQGATQLKIAGDMAEAWLLNGALYVRTRLSLLSPAFTDHVGSAEGIAVYKYPHFVPSLLASVNGVPTSLLVSGN